ncbi:hypothetical protein [Bacillus sp. P14.5]|uniref:hypothetical protein n=1 Tax=Bacillus sp. P14.5 TaxID=1983400 RepID=UPI0013B068CF|nr:hypothetical protein [Bacillus sp. P14.5]
MIRNQVEEAYIFRNSYRTFVIKPSVLNGRKVKRGRFKKSQSLIGRNFIDH